VIYFVISYLIIVLLVVTFLLVIEDKMYENEEKPANLNVIILIAAFAWPVSIPWVIYSQFVRKGKA
jgi:glycopeptide antibiotics resistance protein